MSTSKEAILDVKDLRKSFFVGDWDVPVLKGLNFEVNYGDFVVIFGPSGCGKSTLLHCVMGLEEPSMGSVLFFGNDLYKNAAEDQRAMIRKRYVGMVYQQPNWVKAYNVVENVAFPLILLGMDKQEAIPRAKQSLAEVGMEIWAEYLPTELSSGQQQRVALARALIHNPQIVIADEPTGNLDYQSGRSVMQLLADMNVKRKKTVIMVTHDLEYLKYAKRAIQMFNGEILKIYDEKDKEDLMKQVHFKRGDEVKAQVSESKVNLSEDGNSKK